MWNMILAYTLVAVILCAYTASILLRTRKLNQDLGSDPR